MKVLLYADFRSPTARAWANGLRGAGLEVYCISSELVDDDYPVVQPTGAVSRLRQLAVRARNGAITPPRGINIGEFRPNEGLQAVLAITRTRERRAMLSKHARFFSPDIVHALRLPYEGLTVLGAGLKVPVVISTWGQDFVPQAEGSRLLQYWLHCSVKRANGIQYDAPIDHQRALKYGLQKETPALYAAGNFGIDTSLFPPSDSRVQGHILYPRGRAESANGIGFIRAVKLLKHREDLRFTAIGLKGISYAERAASDPELAGRLLLTPRLSREAFAKVLGTADVLVSPAFTDGTPNSILEALACGVTVVAGNIPSIANLQKEVGVLNLVDHGSDSQLASAISTAVGRTSSPVELPEHYSIRSNHARVMEFYTCAIENHRNQSRSEHPSASKPIFKLSRGLPSGLAAR